MTPLRSDDLTTRRRQRRAQLRRRRIGAAAATLAVVGGGVWVLTRGRDDTAPTARTPAPARTTPAPRTTPTRAAPATPATDGMPSAQAQAQAVARYVRLGLPISRGGGRGRYVALTFDDGPGPMTATLLSTLRANRMRATFFLVGRNVGRWPSLPRRETAFGAVGNHSWSHAYLPGLSAGAAQQEMSSTQRAVADATRLPVTLFRPPYGAHTAGIDRQAHQLGMLPVLWSVDSGDSQGAMWDRMLATMKAGARPGAIILLHENRGQTEKAINRFLPWLRKRGLVAVSVPELLALDPPPVAQVRADATRRVGARY